VTVDIALLSDVRVPKRVIEIELFGLFPAGEVQPCQPHTVTVSKNGITHEYIFHSLTSYNEEFIGGCLFITIDTSNFCIYTGSEECTPACPDVANWYIIISGAKNAFGNTCSDCAAINGTWLLPPNVAGSCYWGANIPIGECNIDTQIVPTDVGVTLTFNSDNNGQWQVELSTQFGGSMIFVMPASGWTCYGGTNTPPIFLVGFYACDFSNVSVTLYTTDAACACPMNSTMFFTLSNGTDGTFGSGLAAFNGLSDILFQVLDPTNYVENAIVWKSSIIAAYVSCFYQVVVTCYPSTDGTLTAPTVIINFSSDPTMQTGVISAFPGNPDNLPMTITSSSPIILDADLTLTTTFDSGGGSINCPRLGFPDTSTIHIRITE
jgi:hypothetical protein